MPDKKYLIEIPGMPEGSGVWDAAKWERNKDLFMNDYPDANVFELGEYDADDAKETDQIMLDLGNEAMSGVWDNAKWERNKDLVMSDYPDVQVSRVRHVDYWGQRAEENRARKAQLQQPDADRNSRLAEIGYYDDLSENQQEFNLGTDLSYGLKPLSSAIETNSVSGETTYLDPRVKEFFANDSAETDRQAEIARLDAEYEQNPSVIAQREWEAKQREERAKYAEELTNKIKADFEEDVDLAKAAEGERAKYAHFGTGGGRYLADVSAVAENSKKEKYSTALKFMEKAAIARDVAGKGFGGAVVDWTKEGLLDLVTQDDIEAYNEIGNILTRLENEVGSLKSENLTEEVFDRYLTKDEQALIKSFYEYNAAMADAQQNMSRAYKGGKIFAESVPFMLEFLATGGIYKAAGKAATKGLASALAKWVVGAGKGTASRVARKVVAKATRDAIYAGVGTLARTVASPGTYDRMAEASIQIDEDGHLNRAKNAAVAFADMYVENLSEISGKLIGDTLGLLGKGAGWLMGKVPLSKIGGMLGDNAFMQGLAKLGKGVQSFMPKLKALGFHGLPEEVGEEFIGNAIREISGIQPGALKEMVADDNFGAMLIGFAPMTMLGVAGGIYNLGVVNAKAAQLGKDLRENFGSTYSEEELDHIMGVIQNAQTAEDIQKALKPMAMAVVDSFEKGMITQEEMTEQIEMLYQYGGFMAQNNALLFGKKAQDRQMMDAKREEFTGQYGRFWQEDQSETVQIATLNNGSTVFVTSAPAEDGKITTIDVTTGKKGFANVSDIATQEVEGEQIQSTNSMTMDAFLNGQIATQRKTTEETRMNNERDAQIQALAAQITPGTRINLGTEGSPVIVFTKRTNKNGVVIVDETGMESLLGWEQAAYALGQPIKVETDQQKLDAEISDRLQRMAERRMQRAVTPASQATAEAAEGAAAVVAQEQQNIPLNEDGTVNEALFWTQDPEGYVKWNDEQNKDGGQDSLRQIAISKQELFGMLNEAATGQNTSNPTMRKAAEKQVAAIAEKIARLEALEMSYADALAEETEAIKQTAATPVPPQPKPQNEEDRRKPLREKAKELSDKLGVKVNIAENLSDVKEESAREQILRIDISGSDERATGWFNPETGEVTIYLPHTTDTKEIERTIVHEVVAHKGLRGLLGEEGFNVLCDSVWNMMTEEERTKFLAYPGVNGNTRAAADEYIAHYAENINLEESKPVWDRIMDLIMRILNSLGVNVELSKEQLSDIIVASYQRLVQEAKNSVPSQNGQEENNFGTEGRDQFSVPDSRTGREGREQNEGDSGEISGGSLGLPGNRPDVGGSRRTVEGAQLGDGGEVVSEAEESSPEDVLTEEGFETDEQNDDIRFSVRYLPTPEQRESIIDSIINITGRTRDEAQREQLFNDAKALYGVTENSTIAGYMLPDGAYLNFADKEGEPGIRGIDHRNIGSVINDREYESRYDYVIDFVNEGAIRMLPEYAGFQLSVPPTAEQRSKLMDYIYKHDGEVIMEITDENGGPRVYMEYNKRTSPSRIFRDMDNFFNEGVVPGVPPLRFRMSNDNQAIFVSNAARAVEGIKQEKATPEQWLKMIEKNGGLKAGEDKWMGLSDWLKASDKKTLTKQEVLDFINENMIIIEEQHYAQLGEFAASGRLNEVYPGWEDGFSIDWDGYMEEPHGEISDNEAAVSVYNEHHEKKIELDEDGEFVHTEDMLDVEAFAQELAEIYYGKDSNIREIHGTRLNLTTPGLTNNREIALTIPTIDPYQTDDVHFTDAGDGRAVAWIRFGETTTGLESNGMRIRSRKLADELEKKYGSMWNSDETYEQMSEEDKAKRDEADRLYHLSDVDAEWIENKRQFANRMAERGYTEAAERERREADEAERLWSEYRAESSSKKVLVIDEIQSKRHQEGREKGYKTKDYWPLRTKYLTTKTVYDSFYRDMEDKYGEAFSEASTEEDFRKVMSESDFSQMLRIKEDFERASNAYIPYRNSVPDAPFDKNWHELAMKRMLRYAAENGYDVVAWTKGDQQAERYNIGSYVSSIEMQEEYDGNRDFGFYMGDSDESLTVTVDENGTVVSAEDHLSQAEGRPLADLVGKEMAVKMMQMEEYDVLEDIDLKVGNEGMKGFYDKMLPAFMNKYGKKWGVKVEDINLPNLKDGLIMHSVPVTEEMKASVMEGQVMFRTTQNPLDAPLTAEERAKINEFFPGFSENNSDIRPFMNSLRQELTPNQQEFFANSKAVDKDGNLLVLYHGTPRAGFTEFESGWFTTSKEDAISYSGDRKGRLFDPNEKYEPETLTSGDFRLGYMTFDSEEDRAAFLERFPYAGEVMPEEDYESARLGADEEYDALTARRDEFAEVWNAYREYERERFVDTTIGDLIANPEAYTEDDLRRAMLAYDSNANFDSLDDMDATERKDALVSALQNANEETEGGILDMVVATRVPRNGEGQKHNDLGNRTYEVYANIENPYEIDANGRGSEFESGDIYKSVEEALADEQYDGVIIHNWRVGRTQQLGDVVVPKNGSQIKLTSNENPTESGDIQFRITEEGEDPDIRFRIRTKPAPKKTGIGYKVFYLKDGKLYPPMVANQGGVDTPVGVWLDAEEGTRAGVSKTGRPKVKQGGKGTQGGSGTLAYRPGWHLGEIPYAIQFNRKDENGDRTLFPADFVWAEVEYANDVDYQEEAMSYGMNANGKFQHSLAGLPKLPADGSYRYRTNPNPETDPWIITGAMKVNRLLTPSEVDQMVIDAGREPQKRQEGAVTDEQINTLNKKLGLDTPNSEYLSELLDKIEDLDENARKKIVDLEKENAERNEDFNQKIEEFNEESSISMVFKLGHPTIEMMLGGVKNKPIVLYGNKLWSKMKKHGFLAAELRNLPKRLGHPIAIFNNHEKSGGRSILTELTTRDGNFLVAINVGKGDDVDINIVSTVFGKTDNNIVSWINKEYLTYVNKEKALSYLHHTAPIAGATESQGLSSATKIVESFENSKHLPHDFYNENSQTITFDNFYESTSGIWKAIPVSEVPQREPDYTSKKFMSKAVSSRYWYESDENGDYVIRESDHWSSIIKGEITKKNFEDNPYSRNYTSIASCRWGLDVIDAQERYGKVKDEYISDGKTYGKIYLSDLKQRKTSFRITGTPTDEVVANGLNLSPAQTAEVAANIFAALPEESREKITEGLNGNILGLKDAILQIPTSLATKENWNEEDRVMAAVVREVIQDLVDANPTSRPLTTKEALWLLYDSTNPVKDLVDAASRAFVAHNLGFDPASMQRKQEVDDYIRFRTASNGAIDAATDMYNYETSIWTERLKESWSDMNQSVVSLQKAMAEASGMAIEPWENIEFALNRLSSKSYADKKRYLRDFLMPMWDTILDIVKHDHVSIEGIERYMMLKHGLERNNKFASRDAKEFYRAMYNVVAERMKSQSHAEQVVALSEANKALADIRAKMANAAGKKLANLQEAEKKAMMDVKIADLVLRGDEKQNEAELQAYYDAIDNEADPKYHEFREKDYGGLTSMFVDTTDVKRSDYKSEEAYQQAVLAATTPKFTKVADMEAEAKTEVDAFENKVYMYRALWDSVNAATKETLRHQYESGMITLEQYEAVRDMFEYYIPLRGFADNAAEDMYSYYMNNSAGGFTKPILGAKGRKTRAESPLGWIGTMAESAIQSDNKNQAKMCLYYMTLRRPDQNLLTITETWYEYTGQKDSNGKKIFKAVYPPAVSQALSADDLRQHMDIWEADMKQKQSRGEAYKGSQKVDLKNSVIFQDAKEEKEHIVNVKVAGKDYSILINGNPRAAQAINGLLNPDANTGPVAQWVGNARRNLSALLTSYSPLFWVANYQRDLLSSVMRVSEADGWDTAMKYLVNRRKAWRVASYIYKHDAGTLGDTYYEKLYKEFAENGGITGYTSLTTNKEYENLLEKYANNVDKHVLNAVKGVWDKFMGFGEAIEQVSRFAAFITAREEGKSLEEAINAAKEVSVNFNRKGSAKPISLDELDKLRTKDGKKLNQAQRYAALVLSAMPGPMKFCYYFVNASIQALSSFVKLAKKSPGKATTWVGMYMGTSIALAMLNYLLSDDDDDEYLNLPDYLRHSTALVKIADGYYFKWSIPQEMRPFYAWADILVRKMMGKMPHKSGAEVGKEMALAASQWLPVNPFEAEDPLLSLVPDFGSPLAEIKANKNAFGGKIYDDMPYKSEGVVKEIPAYRKATEKTGKVYVDMSKFLNDISGGDEVVKGKININPAIMEHLIEGYGGGIYDFAKMMVSIPSMILSDDPLQIKEIPFVNKVILSVDETNTYSHTDEAFYHYKDIADNAKRVEKEYAESDNPERAEAYRQEDDWRVYLLYKQYEDDFKDIRERLDNAVDETEEDLLKQEQNVLREMFLENIAKGDVPEITFQIREDIKRFDKEVKAIMKPVTDANNERLERRRAGDVDGMLEAIERRDSLKETPEYQRAEELNGDLKKIKQQFEELGSVTRRSQRDSVLGELQRNYESLVKKMEQL